MNPWLSTCRAIVGDIRAVLEELPTRYEREPVIGQGVGGDETTQIDQAAEQAVIRRLEELDLPGLTLVSEEIGEQVFGVGAPPLVIVDPIDGSINAKRGIPFFAFSLAVAEGPTMADVVFGYVFDFGSGEEWTARRGGGAFLNGEPIGRVRPKDEIDLLFFEATLSSLIADRAPAMSTLAKCLRVMGSLALSLCHLADGRADGVCSLKEARAVDIAAAQLLVREVGLSIELVDKGVFAEAPLDLIGRSRIAAAGTPELCAQIGERLRA